METREVLGSPYAVFKLKRLRAKVLGIHVRSLNRLNAKVYCLMCENFTLVTEACQDLFTNVNIRRFNSHYSDGYTRLDLREAMRKGLGVTIQSATIQVLCERVVVLNRCEIVREHGHVERELGGIAMRK